MWDDPAFISGYRCFGVIYPFSVKFPELIKIRCKTDTIRADLIPYEFCNIAEPGAYRFAIKEHDIS